MGRFKTDSSCKCVRFPKTFLLPLLYYWKRAHPNWLSLNGLWLDHEFQYRNFTRSPRKATTEHCRPGVGFHHRSTSRNLSPTSYYLKKTKRITGGNCNPSCCCETRRWQLLLFHTHETTSTSLGGQWTVVLQFNKCHPSCPLEVLCSGNLAELAILV